MKRVIFAIIALKSIVQAKLSIVESSSLDQDESLKKCTHYDTETKKWAFANSLGVIQVFAREGVQRPIFIEKSKFGESSTPELKTAIGFYKTSSVNYIIAATKTSKKILILDPENPGKPLIREIETGDSSNIYSLFQIPNTDTCISASTSTGGLKKWNLQDGTQMTNPLSGNSYTSFWTYIEDNLILGSGSLGKTGFIVDTTTMTVKATLTTLAGTPSNTFRYKKTFPTQANTVIISHLTGEIELRDVSSDNSAALKIFPSGITDIYDSKVGMQGIDGTSLIILCSIDPFCTITDPSSAPSGFPLPAIRTVENLSKGGILGLAFQNEEETDFFIVSRSYPQFTRVALCGGDGCGKCKSDYTECEMCNFGFETTDPETGGKVCISECQNKQLERLSTKLSRCVNCLTEHEKDKEVCTFTTDFFLKKTTEQYSDEFSSLTVEIAFKDSSEHLPKISDELKWSLIFKVTVDDFSEGEQIHKFRVTEGKLLLDFNFTKTTGNATLRLKNKQNIIYSDILTHEAKLIFVDSESKLEISTFEKIKESVIKAAQTTSKIMTSTGEAIATGGAAIGILGMFLQFPFMSAILKFILVFKVLNRLRLININSGGILGVFLSNIYNIFEFGQAAKGSGQSYKSKSRNKLDRYNVYVTPFIDIPHIYYFYAIGITLEIIRHKIWQYAKSLDKMSKSDQFLVKILDKMRFMLFSVFVLDLTLYTFNAVTHHDITRPQNGASVQSFVVSNIVASCLVGEVIHMFLLNSNFKFLKKKSKIEKKIQQNSVFLEFDSPKKSTPEVEEEHKPSSMEVKYSSYYEFYSNGMVEKKMNKSKVARFFNLFSLLRLISFEPILVSLQVLPIIQIGMIFLLQLAMSILTVLAVFKVKAFKTCLHSAQNLIFETLFTGVLGIFFLMCYQDPSKMNASAGWRNIQTACVGMICVIALTNIVATVFSLIMKIIQARAEKKKLKELEKGIRVENNDIGEREIDDNLEEENEGEGRQINIARERRKPKMKRYDSRLRNKRKQGERKKSSDRIMKRRKNRGLKKSKFVESGEIIQERKLKKRGSNRSGSDPDSKEIILSKGSKGSFEENPYLKDDPFDFGEVENKRILNKEKDNKKERRERRRNRNRSKSKKKNRRRADSGI